MCVRPLPIYSRTEIIDPIEVDGHLVGHIAQDCGFQAFSPNGSHVGTYLTK